MNKFHVKDKISEYIDGMLNQEEASAVKKHLDRCPECMEEYEEMGKIIVHMNQMESLDTPDSFVEKVHERIEKPKSPQRLVQGLFYPLRIKVPLELAGVAAAALLVIYIVGIRGKQHVYELAYAQRPQPLAVLQKQRMEEGAEVEETVGVKVDEAATLSGKAQPELELKEKKMEKGDKRADTEETITPGKKDLSAFTPQEKRMEKQSKVEEAVPRSKMVKEDIERDLEPQKEAIERKAQIVAEAPSVVKEQKRGEPSLEIADKEKEHVDKEKGEAKEDALAKLTPRDENLEDIVAALDGKIIELEYNENTQVLESLKIEIPAEKYQKLIKTLEERGDIRKPYPTIKEKDQEVITIRLILKK